MVEFPNTRNSETIVLDWPDKGVENGCVLDRKMKRDELMKEEINVFTSMSEAIKAVATAIRESKPVDVHTDIYTAVMD
ncbi:Histone-lysine N-methyltransferase SUVR5 [Hordeum vulgare]|nr:Histone-lysine N-methyltransferase SUVR5 [Hordeum vulgare]